MELSDYDEIPLCKMYVLCERYWDYWWNNADGDAQQIRKWSPCAPTPVILILLLPVTHFLIHST
jgi:hypothetical protein